MSQVGLVIAQMKHHDLLFPSITYRRFGMEQAGVDSTTGRGKTDDLKGRQHVELYRTVQLAARQGDSVRKSAKWGRDTRLEVRVRGKYIAWIGGEQALTGRFHGSRHDDVPVGACFLFSP